MTFTDTALEKFNLFAKLLLWQLPYQKQTLSLEIIEMIDMGNGCGEGITPRRG